MIKKQLKALIIILIFLTSGVTQVVSFSNKDNDNYKGINNIINNFKEINIEDDNIEFDELKNQSIELMKRIVGNESNIGSCGRAYINSTGIGLHLARVRPLLQIVAPIELYYPYWLMFPRWTARMFYICSIYGRDKDAETIIELRDTNETIHLKGPHIIIGGIFIFFAQRFVRTLLKTQILPTLNKIKLWRFPLLNNLTNFLDHIKQYDGHMFWHNFNYWKNWKINETAFFPIIDELLHLVSNLIVRREINRMVWNIMPVKSQLLGLITPLDWDGYFPFFVWYKL